MSFDKNEIRNHAKKFDESVFKEKIEKFVQEKYEETRNLKKWIVK